MSQYAKVFLSTLAICGFFVGFSSWSHGMDGPDSVELDSLVNIYQAVTFDHAMHAESFSCAGCHHHATGDQVEESKCLPCHAQSAPVDEVACSSCHPGVPDHNATTATESMKASLVGWEYHRERTGLKRAYHLKCLGCHSEMSDASGCDDCHMKNTPEEKAQQRNKKE